MQKSKQDKLDTVIKATLEDSLAELLPQAAQLVWQEFCSDCARKDYCHREHYFCHSAQVRTKVYLHALVVEKAKLN